MELSKKEKREFKKKWNVKERRENKKRFPLKTRIRIAVKQRAREINNFVLAPKNIKKINDLIDEVIIDLHFQDTDGAWQDSSQYSVDEWHDWFRKVKNIVRG